MLRKLPKTILSSKNCSFVSNFSTSSSCPQKRALTNINPKDVFANNQLNLSDINIYGFDYDYTLASYTPNKVENFIHQNALKNLVNDKLYPRELLDIKYDNNFVIRGLHYDIENQLLMKLDSYSVINQPGLYRLIKNGQNKKSDFAILTFKIVSFFPFFTFLTFFLNPVIEEESQ